MRLRFNISLFCLIVACQSGFVWSQQSQLNPKGLRVLEQQNCGLFFKLKIVGGHEVKLASRPWMAILLLRNDGEEDYACGGTLITERFVLTAAHCVSRFQLVHVRLGEHQFSTETDCRNTGRKSNCVPPVEDRSYEEIYIHEAYDRHTGHNDIALIKLASAVEYKKHIKPICLPITDELVRATESIGNLLVTGWGTTEEETGSDVLMEATINTQSPLTCAQSFLREIKQSQLCVGDTTRDSCKGDSGGPISYPSLYMNRQRFVQFGIVSYGARECGTGYPGVYTKVSSFMPWITNILAANL